MNRTVLSILVLAAVVIAGAAPVAAQLSFAPQVTYVAGTGPDTTALGDFNKDGDLDAAVTSDAPDKVTIHSNDGSGVFALTQIIVLGNGTSPNFIVAADLDGDGDLDLALTLKNANAVTVLFNNAGVFTASGVLMAVGAEPRSLVAVNIDGDADVDLVTSNRSSNTISILRNNGNATFLAAVHVPVGADPRRLAAADLDGDGDRDLVVANNDSNNVSVLLNNGTGAFVLTASLPTGNFDPEGIVAVDLDGDHVPDLAVSADDGTVIAQNAVLVFRNLGGGSFSFFTPFPVNALGAGFIAAADLDLDGDLDVATANQDSGNVSALANNGLGSFGAPLLVAVGSGPGHVAAGDVNGDQVPDLVATNDGSATVSVLRNVATNGTLSMLTAPAIGTIAQMQVSSPPDAGDPYVAVFALGTTPGITLYDGRHIPVNDDLLLSISLTPNNGFFLNTAGILGISGTAVVSIVIPPLPVLIGESIYADAGIMNAVASFGIEQSFGPLQITFQ